MPAETIKHVDEQLKRAAKPNAKTPLETLVRNNGVKDQISQPIIERLTAVPGNSRSKKTTGANGPPHEDVSNLQTLAAELEKLREEGMAMNPLLDMDGTQHVALS